MRDRVTGIHFAVLNKHKQKYLDVLSFRVLLVKDEKLCELSCVGSHQCFSFNLVADGGMLRCELLSTDMFNSSQKFIYKTNSVHFSIKSTCYPMPCKNNGTCIPFYNNNTHSCNCTYPPYYGEQCDKVEGLHWSPWSLWSDTCGPKPIQTSLTKHRSRNCTYNSPRGEEPSNECVGLSVETQNCESIPMTAEEIAGCDSSVGLEDNRITDSQMTASSYYPSPGITYPWYARLNHHIAWAPSTPSIGEYLQIDFKKKMRLTKIASQGRSNSNQWVTKYSLKYSDDGSTWENYGSDSYIKEFDANNDVSTVVTHTLEVPIDARYIRIIVVGYNSWPAIRMELYGCTYP
ncbi:lactadherin-like [Actinia tenebrosa]|uniref:Lactadherin-like n=1 Tax=Actinia tenebrosa TaxID=6105 RepID=A0A6P8IIU1_ACTTE|nr:lactadherin-like [Actinia tenebrosa]